ncbi:MAG: DUF1275 domain-containing protein [Methylobacterium mesophilicum]|nr:DUF1275 domain-containing protein [Methylobacterium mesophilicum]
MLRTDKRHWGLAVCLASLAGYVDAIGFLKLGGLFVSFMSGNSTRLAVGVATNSAIAVTAASLIGAFLLGVVLGALIAHRAGAWRKPAVLVFVSALLAGAAGLDRLGDDAWSPLAMALAMGAANCVFQRNGEVSIGVTYMTGTLVKLGQRLASALLGGERFVWVPYLMLWCGLVAGALAGASLYPLVGANSLWGAAGLAGLLALLAYRLGPARLQA